MKALQTIGAVLLGAAAFFTVILALGLLFRAWPDYVAAKSTFAFTAPMLAARLLVGAIAALAAGWFAVKIAPSGSRAGLFTTALLVLFFAPVHMHLIDRFPLWYHAAFFVSLVVLIPVGANLAKKT
jgi:uncharacterized membrane protein YeaQ/YmgE (transglycosylase-associated protein family)